MIELSYDEIILQVRKNNEEALVLLFSLVENYVKYIGKKMIIVDKLVDHSLEDIKMIGLSLTKDSVNNYEFNKALFFAYWKIIFLRYMNGIRELHQHENKMEYEKKSLDEEMCNYKYYDRSQITLKDAYTIRETYDNCIKKVVINFDKRTAKILMLWSEGYTYGEIAKSLKISVSKVNYEISKALIFLKNQEK